MTALSIQPPFPIMTDIDGQPLEDGYIFIGIANLAPIGNPITVYWDANLTIAAAQPIRTRGGYPMNSGTPARLYVNSNYSIQIQNKNGSVVYSSPVATERFGDVIPYFSTAYGGVGNGVTNNVTALTNAVANSPDQIRVIAGNYALNSDVSLGDRILEMTQGASFSGTGRATPGNQSFINSERFGVSYRNTSIAAYNIYGSIFPNVSYYDVVQAVARLAPGSALASHISAIAGYIQVDAPATGIGNNAVALFGGGRINVDNGIGWGINTLLQDNQTRTTHTGTGRYMLGAELDFNVMGVATQVVGISVGGNSLVQPTTANAYLVNTLSQSLGYKWGAGLFSLDGCANIGIALGALAASGTNINSQPMLFSYFDGAGVKKTYTLRAAGTDFFEIIGGDVSIQGGDLLLALPNGIAIGGSVVVGARQTGWTLATGTAYFGAWNANTLIPNTGNWAADQAATRTVVDTISRRLLAVELALTYHGLIGLT